MSDAAEKVAAAVAETVVAQVEAATAITEATVAAAEDRADAAVAAAQAITDSVRESAVVARVDDALEELDEWEGEVNSKLEMLTLENKNLRAELSSMAERVTKLEASPTVVLTPLPSQEQPEIPAPAPAAIVAKAVEPAAVVLTESAPAPVKRKPRWT